MKSKNIVIIGGGPAGATAAIRLSRAGHSVALFHTPKRPELIVGESLLPAVIPILRDLGIEETVKSYSSFKPGATIVLNKKLTAAFDFGLGSTSLGYAYNVPRDLFDQTLLDAAAENGAKIIHERCNVEVDEQNQKVTLSKQSKAAIADHFNGNIDLIVDASGRSRLLARKLNIPSKMGGRKDVALFAHCTNVHLEDKGNIHVDRYDRGWGWRIPLPGRVSIGIVVDPKHLKAFGSSKEEQFDNFIKKQPAIYPSVQNAERITNVLSYTNYQLKSEQLYGQGWVIIGDAAGFIDPVFSTGLFLAMDGAIRMTDAFNQDRSMEVYAEQWSAELSSWQTVIDSWYEGTLLSLLKKGLTQKKNPISNFINRYMTKHVTRIFTGELKFGSYSHRLLNFSIKYGVDKGESFHFRIR